MGSLSCGKPFDLAYVEPVTDPFDGARARAFLPKRLTRCIGEQAVMTNLVSLPEELILQICQLLGGVGCSQELCNLCLTCPRFRSSALSVLYNVFPQKVKNDGQILLLQSVLERPSLGSLITQIKVECSYEKLLFDPAPFRRAIRSLDVEFVEEWIDRLTELRELDTGGWLINKPEDACSKQGSKRTPLVRTIVSRYDLNKQNDVVIALALAFLPNLRDLEFVSPGTCGVILSQLLTSPQLIPSWQKVERLVLQDPILIGASGLHRSYEYTQPWRNRQDNSIDMGNAWLMLHMPALRQLHIAAELVVDPGQFQINPRSWDIVDLRIQAPDLFPEFVFALFHACKALTRAKYYQHGSYLIPIQRVINALAMHGSTLQALTLIGSRSDPDLFPPLRWDHLRWDGPRQVTSLLAFEVLRDLRIDAPSFFPLKLEETPSSLALPGSLRRLEVRKIQPLHLGNVKAFVPRLDKVPHLETFALRMDNCWDKAKCLAKFTQIGPLVVQRGKRYTLDSSSRSIVYQP